MESAIAAFTVVGWTGEGSIEQATYNMVGRGSPGEPLPPDDKTTVVGILLEDLNFRETGAVLIQGIVTNPAWNWTEVTRIGAPLWVDNFGMLVPQDPHFTDVITYPTGRVPVARVIASDTIIFEQGLGGKGEKGSGSGAGNVVNIGNGEGIFAAVVNEEAQLKSLVAGNNITLSSTVDDITINAIQPSYTYSKGGTWVSTSGDPISAPVNDVYLHFPVQATIQDVIIFTEGGPGSCEIDVRVTPLASYPPTVGDSIVALSKPTISNGITYEDNVLDGWDPIIPAGSILSFSLDSSTTFTMISISLTLQQ
jgi:hypothetical protein